MVNKKQVRVIQPTVKVKNKNIDLSSYVNVIETYKSLKQPAGTFSIELSPKNSKDNITSYNLSEFLYKSIEPMDVIEIGITKPGLMVGIVDSTDKTKGIRTDNYTRNLNIKGRDFAKLLIDDSIVYSPQLANNEYAKQVLGEERLVFVGELSGAKNTSVFNSPICAILFVLKNIPSVHIEVPFTDMSNSISKEQVTSGKIGDYFISDMKAYLGDRVSDAIVNQFSAKIWNFLLLCIDDNFYELFVDTVTVKGASGDESRPCLFLRPKPYDRTSDDVIRLKDVYSKGKSPTLQTIESLSSVKLNFSPEDLAGLKQAEEAGADIIKNLINFNKVIYPRAQGDLIVQSKTVESPAPVASPAIPGKSETNTPSNTGTSHEIATYVAISGLNEDGTVPDKIPPQFEGQRDINKIDDPNNKSMVIPWTWDGNDSFFRTMVTNEPYHTLNDEDIIQEYLGTIDEEVVNYITVRSKKDLNQDPKKSLLGYSYPLMDAYKIRRFGLRAYNVESNLLHSSYKLTASEAKNYKISKPDRTDIFSASEYVNNRERIFNWYRYNDIFESGVIIIRGNQDIRIGDKIRMPDAISKGGRHGIFAYVQGVKNRYEITQTGVKFETTLELIRGENPEDIQEYKAQKNSGTGNNLKLGSTYENYDNALGQSFDGKPDEANAHNIIKYDRVINISTLNAKNSDVQKPENTDLRAKAFTINNDPNASIEPKYSGFISTDVTASRNNIGVMTGADKPLILSGNTGTQIDKGEGTNKEGQTQKINDKIFFFLEAIGSACFPFKIEVKKIVDNEHTYIDDDNNKQIIPGALGNAVDIAVEGAPGSNDYIKRTTMFISYILGLKVDNKNLENNPIKSLLTGRGVMPKMIITCPNQDNAKDLNLCLGISDLSTITITDFKDNIRIIY